MFMVYSDRLLRATPKSPGRSRYFERSKGSRPVARRAASNNTLRFSAEIPKMCQRRVAARFLSGRHNGAVRAAGGAPCVIHELTTCFLGARCLSQGGSLLPRLRPARGDSGAIRGKWRRLLENRKNLSP
ncbi:hypothetical protein EVAR_74365_1 [Eumeta japonica]|uniref:Uncharacterized protein n=1 Tax=Eumeta variegata TaxID=151549 RepID=A0A4C1SFT6_EUMVA|nr:hypothetical protein EVAR_74365_1 [Eumeta japonica]